MIDLHRYFLNPFDDPEIGLPGLLAFSTDHLQRMMANNPGGGYSSRIAATSAALQLLESTATEDQTKLGIRKARKRAKLTFRRTLSARLAKLHGAVVARFGAKGAGVAECFPLPRTRLVNCADDLMESHLRAVITGMTARQAELGAAVLADAEALHADWLAVYEASESSSGAKAKAEQGQRAARRALQLELFLNLLALAAQFPRQPERMDLFLQQTLLAGGVARRRRKAKRAVVPTPGPSEGAKAMLES